MLFTAHTFNRLNNLAGWCCFTIAAVVYLLTIEPTVSFWDCGELIAAADKLEVGHPPGAPLFLLLSRLFALFAPNVANVAMMVNLFSALASAFTILFLFWSITHITRRIVERNGAALQDTGYHLSILLSGMVGALAYAFSDTFWFSAVEGEVYGVSSLFTAIVFWAILKWEKAADTAYANRWLILIAFLMGLSIGVHLLNLLAIPAIVLVFYFKKYIPTAKGVVVALLCAAAILTVVLYGIIPWVVKLAGYFELLFVNKLGLPYNSGVLCYMVLLVLLLTGGLVCSYRLKKHIFHTILLSVTVILIGYSSYSVIVIRSLANTPMNENTPDNVFSLMGYLNREQYGDRPLFYGAYYNAPETGRDEYNPVYTKMNGRYEITHRNVRQVFDTRFTTLFPRMYSTDANHIEVYKTWAGITGRPIIVTDNEGNETTVYKPSFAENIRFFVRYQLGHMYGRYFMWNFAGRQNDIQSDGGILKGNWLSGISLIDDLRLGPQGEIPPSMKDSAGRNVYFMLPLLFGLIGLLWHWQRDRHYCWVVMCLFVMTGIAIVVYLNQTPLQARERDYAYAGSFYAFAIWIGLGAAAIYNGLREKIPNKAALIGATLLSCAVPVIMAQQNYHDHDRSQSYTARDIALNYLNSCPPDAILFTIGDNDTFPLWYLQEVEGIRRDVRVVNLMLLNADWYISQMKRTAYDSKPLPVHLPEDRYLTGQRDFIYLMNVNKDTVNLRSALKFIDSNDPQTRLHPEPDVSLDYFTCKNFSLTVDKEKTLANGTVRPEHAAEIEDELYFHINSSYLGKSDWMVLEIIAANNWDRPVCWTSCRHSGTVGLDNYLQLNGSVYRLVPLKTPSTSVLTTGCIDTGALYDQLMNQFHWGRFEQPNAWIDNQNIRALNIIHVRHLYTRLALQLTEENQPERAAEVLDRALTLFPPDKLPYDYYTLLQAEAFFLAGQPTKANDLLAGFACQCLDELHYYYSLPSNFYESVEQEVGMVEALLAEITRVCKANGQESINEMIQRRLEKHQ
jgi:tetratricopeptide (TPR) repeat protein